MAGHGLQHASLEECARTGASGNVVVVSSDWITSILVQPFEMMAIISKMNEFEMGPLETICLTLLELPKLDDAGIKLGLRGPGYPAVHHRVSPA